MPSKPAKDTYILPHTLTGERQRLALMSHLLDPLHRALLEKRADYCLETIKEFRPRLLESGQMTRPMLSSFNRLYANPRLWTSAITFVASWGTKPRARE